MPSQGDPRDTQRVHGPAGAYDLGGVEEGSKVIFVIEGGGQLIELHALRSGRSLSPDYVFGWAIQGLTVPGLNSFSATGVTRFPSQDSRFVITSAAPFLVIQYDKLVRVVVNGTVVLR